MSVFETAEYNGYRVHVYSTRKFKTMTVSALLQASLDPDTATAFSLLPFLLLRGTRRSPTDRDLGRRLAAMYGANLQADIKKKGEKQILQITMQSLKQYYGKTTLSFVEDTVKLMGEVLFEPCTEKGAFRSEFVEAEKKKHAKRQLASRHDSRLHALDRCLSEMCKDEPFAVPRYGDPRRLDNLSPMTLYEHYDLLRTTCIMDVYFVGDICIEQALGLISKLWPVRNTGKQVPLVQANALLRPVRTLIEDQQTPQGRLVLGYRTGTTYADPDYFALLTCNGVLGSLPSSKLFQQVRVHHQMAYYILSRLDSHKGLLYVQAGIQDEDYEKAVPLIMRQLWEIQSGHVGANELESAKASLINFFKEQVDSPEGIIDVHYNGVLCERPCTFSKIIDLISAVTKECVVDISNRISLDMIYYLRGKEGG